MKLTTSFILIYFAVVELNPADWMFAKNIEKPANFPSLAEYEVAHCVSTNELEWLSDVIPRPRP